jgi:signal transduction histidine kinase
MTSRVVTALMFQIGQVLKWCLALLRDGGGLGAAQAQGKAFASLPAASSTETSSTTSTAAASARPLLSSPEHAAPAASSEYQPRLLVEKGLALALQSEINLQTWPGQPSQASLQVSTGSEMQRLPQAVEAAAFWIAREALSNALNPTHATRVLLTLDIQKAGLRMEVHDIGHGLLGTAQPRPCTGHRLNAGAWPRDLDQHASVSAMRLRAHEVGARLTLRSDPQQGTRLILRWLPLAALPSRATSATPARVAADSLLSTSATA